MTDLNEKAAECMGFRKVGNFKENTIPSYYSGKQFICYVSEWLPEHRMDHAWMLVEKLQKTGSYVAIETHDYIPQTDEMIDCWRVCVNGLFFHYAPTAPEAITAACVEALSKCPK